MTKDGYLRVSDDKKIITYVVVSDNNTEETRFIRVTFIFSLLGSLELLYASALFLRCIHLMQPAVVFRFKVFQTDVLHAANVFA